MPDYEVLNLEAEHHADLDILVESREAAVQARFTELLTDPDERKEALWLRLEADLDLVFYDFRETDLEERNDDWRRLYENMIMVSRLQVWYDVVKHPGFLQSIEAAGQRIDRAVKAMSTDELLAAAQKGIGKGRISAAKEKKLAGLQEDND